MIKHDRNKHITFDSDRHVYTYRGDQVFKGVTSWIGEYNEPFNATQIARKLAQWRDQTAQEILDEWEETRKYGDFVHEVIENYVNENSSLEIDELKHFKNIIEENNLATLASEWVVYDEDIERASAIDLVCKNEDGQYVVVDLKTREDGIESKSYKDKRMYAPLDDLPASRYYKYCLQVNIYKYWLKYKYDLDVAPVHYILNVHKNGAEMIPVFDMEGKIKQMYEQL